RERVFERAPLIIRRGLDPAAADAQVSQLNALGVDAESLPDSDALIWLRRDQRVRGPLPEHALGRYASTGDQWCHDGGQEWFAWQLADDEAPLPPALPIDAVDTSTSSAAPHDEPPPLPDMGGGQDEPPPLPDMGGGHSEPPPLPASPAIAPSAAPPALSTFAVVAALFSLLAMLWRSLAPIALLLALVALLFLWRRPLLRGRAYAVAALVLSAVACGLWLMPPMPAPVPPHYVARPLRPLEPGTNKVAAATPCANEAATPKNDEDRFLLTGQRMLTGRAQRKGDTYVAEAAVSMDDKCQPSALQLYVFRNGVFVGAALEKAVSLATTRLTQFDLTDDQHLRITLAQCTDKPGDCAATTIREIAVLPGAGGWTLGEMK
ncbi:MAG TPA: hypothetical protein VGI53_09870, partial [Dyella sp.]